LAYIEKRGPHRYRVRYAGPDGRERSKTYKRRTDAELFATKVEADLSRGEWTDPKLGRIKLADWVTIWERTELVDLRATTRALNIGVVRNHILPRFGAWPIGRIRTIDVQQMVADERGAARLSNSAIRRHVFVLSTILAAAVRDGRLARNACADVRLPAEQPRGMRFLEPQAISALASAVRPQYYRPLILTAAFVGLRWGELAGLRVDKVDVLRRTIRVDEQLVDVGGRLTFGPPKTKAGIRSVAIPASLADVLGAHVATPPARASGLVFPTPSGTPMRRGNFGKVWRRACADAGFDGGSLDGLVFHELRHTAAALAIAEGAHPLAIKERLGHSSISVTMDTYGGLFPRLDEAIAEALDTPLRRALTAC
jgi:integrase